MKIYKYILLLSLTLLITSCSGDSDSLEPNTNSDEIEQQNDNSNETPLDNEDSIPNGGNQNSDDDSKDTLILSGNISNEEAADLISTKVGKNTQGIQISNTTQLTKIDISKIETLSWLTINNNEKLKQVSLLDLKEASLAVQFINNLELEIICLPMLKKVGSINFINNDRMVSLPFKNIESLTSSLNIGDNSGLEEISLPKMEVKDIFNDSGISIYGNSLLKKIEIPLVNKIQRLSIYENLILEEMDFSSLEKIVDQYFVRSNNNLGFLNFPSLKELGSDLFVSSSINDHRTINFPKLRVLKGDITITRQENLELINFPLLESVGKGLSINNCPNLIELNFPNLLNIGGGISIEGNSKLTSIEFPNLDTISRSGIFEINIRGDQLLKNINFDSLKNLGGGEIRISGISSTLREGPLDNFPLIDINLRSIVNVERLIIETFNIGKLDFSSLRSVGHFSLVNTIGIEKLSLANLFNASLISISNNKDLINLDMPNLEEVTLSFSFSGNERMINLELEHLMKVSNLSISNNKNLESVNFSNLQEISDDLSMPDLYGSLNILRFPELRKVDRIDLAAISGERVSLDTFDLSSLTDFNEILTNSRIQLNSFAIDLILNKLVDIEPQIIDKRVELYGIISSSGLEYERILKDRGNKIFILDN